MLPVVPGGTRSRVMQETMSSREVAVRTLILSQMVMIKSLPETVTMLEIPL